MGHRHELLDGLRRFVVAVQHMPGIRRITVLGSIVTAKSNPKDIDVLVVVTDDADLTPLATASRRLQGHAQSFNRGADVFLANEHGTYIGRAAAGGIAVPVCGGRAMRCIAGNGRIYTTISKQFV